MPRPIVVTAKTNPDLDGVACALAYVELLQGTGRPAEAAADGRPDAEARFVLDHLELTLREDPPNQFSGFVLVDMSALPGLPDFVDPASVVEVIDHRLHGDPTQSYPNARVQVEPVGAAATLVYERFEAAGVVPSARSALLLQAAIHSNTHRQLAGRSHHAAGRAFLVSADRRLPPTTALSSMAPPAGPVPTHHFLNEGQRSLVLQSGYVHNQRGL